MAPNLLFKKLIGKWEGSCRTWFEPDRLADESNVLGDITEVLEGRFLRHTYHGMLKGKPRRGEEMIAYKDLTFCGVAKFLEEANDSRITLFI